MPRHRPTQDELRDASPRRAEQQQPNRIPYESMKMTLRKVTRNHTPSRHTVVESRSAVMLDSPTGGETNYHGVTRQGSTLGETAAMENTLAVWCVILGGVMVLIPVLVLVLLFVTGADWNRHPRAVVLLFLMTAALRRWYGPQVLFTVGSLLLAYGVATLAHASHSATLSAVGIALLCSILFWGWCLVRIPTRRR